MFLNGDLHERASVRRGRAEKTKRDVEKIAASLAVESRLRRAACMNLILGREGIFNESYDDYEDDGGGRKGERDTRRRQSRLPGAS